MKEILNEWRQFLLTEVQTLKLIDLTTSAKENGYSQNDIQLLTQFWNNNSKIRGKYSKVIEKEISDPNKNEPIAHILSAVKSHYNFVYDKLSSTEKMKLASSEDIDVGKLRVQADLAEQEVEDNIDPMKFSSRGIRDQCKYENGRPVVGRYADFDVVYSGDDWVVIEPKSVKGSIAWSHGKPDGSEETEEEYRVIWCTGTKSDNYYNDYAIDYHMFYCIPTDYEEVKVSKPNERRLCLGFINYKGKAYLACDEDLPRGFIEKAVVVNANNDEITKEDVFLLLKNLNLYNSLEKLCSTRKNTRLKEKYKNVSYEEILKNLKKLLYGDLHIDDDDLLDLENNIINCNISFIEKLLNENPFHYQFKKFKNIISKHIIKRKDFLELKDSKEIIRELSEDEEPESRILLAQREDLLELEDGKEIIKKLASDEDKHVRSYVTEREDLLEFEDGKEIIRKLANDSIYFIRRFIAQREDLLEFEDGKEIIRKLANDKEDYVRSAIVQRKDLLEVDPSGDLIRKLANDRYEYVRNCIAQREDLLELEDGKEIIRKLAEDEGEDVRVCIAKRKDLLEVDPSGDLIRKLAEDESSYVRWGIAGRKDLLELEDWKEIIINLLSDENLYVRWDIVKREDLDLLEVDPNGDLIRELINDDFLDNDPDILKLKNKLKSKYKSVFNINECLLKNRMANFLF